MVSARAHTFQIIWALTVCLLAFFLGLGIANLSWRVHKRRNNLYPLMGANTIMTKRTQAIKQALKQNKDTYDFEFTGPHPALGKN